MLEVTPTFFFLQAFPIGDAYLNKCKGCTGNDTMNLTKKIGCVIAAIRKGIERSIDTL